MVLLLTVSVGAVTTAHLTRAMAGVKKVRGDVDHARAVVEAESELEFAKNIVNAARYVGGKNTALTAALAATPPLIPGTTVTVESVGDPDQNWFVLRATGRHQQAVAKSQIFVRQASPVSVYNYFVVDHRLGITGQPRGKIHSNKQIDFFFPGGIYRDPVTASQGFNYVAGATEQNTQFLGTRNQSATPWDITDGLQVSQASKPTNTLNVTQPYIAEVKLQGQTAEVKLYEPAHWITVPVQVQVQVFDHYVTKEVTQQVPTYTTQTVTQTVGVYETQTQTVTQQVPIYETRSVQVTVYDKVWVPNPPPPPGSVGTGDVGGGALGGQWVNQPRTVTQQQQVVVGYTTQQVQKQVQVQVGTTTKQVQQQVVSGYTTQTGTQQVPVYRTETQTELQQRWVPEQYLGTQNVAAEGVFYFEGPVRKLEGDLRGKLSIASNDKVKITGSLQYVDDQGRKRMNHGLQPNKPYEPNPDYTGNAVLGVLSKGDIVYSNRCPEHLEINAALISKQGKVAYEGITVSNGGNTVGYNGSGSRRQKESLRRLGGIVSRDRPVASYVTNDGGVYAGFKKGASLMDRNLIVGMGGVTPPFMFAEDKPLWSMAKSGRIFDPQ